MENHINKAIKFVRENIDNSSIIDAWGKIDKFRCPLDMANPQLYDDIYDLMEEYGMDNDLPEMWWASYYDIEEIFERL